MKTVETGHILSLSEVEARANDYQHCFYSKKYLGDQNELGTMVWHDGINEAVWCLKRYAPANALDVVREKTARKAYVASLSFGGFGIPDDELKSFMERTFKTKL